MRTMATMTMMMMMGNCNESPLRKKTTMIMTMGHCNEDKDNNDNDMGRLQ